MQRGIKVGASKADTWPACARTESTGTQATQSSQARLCFAGASRLLSVLPAPTGGITGPWEGLLIEALAAPESALGCQSPGFFRMNVPWGPACSGEFVFTQRIGCYNKLGKNL